MAKNKAAIAEVVTSEILGQSVIEKVAGFADRQAALAEHVEGEAKFSHAKAIIADFARQDFDAVSMLSGVVAHGKDAAQVEVAKMKLASVEEYYAWLATKEQLANEVQADIDLLEATAMFIMEKIGKRTVFKTHVKGGNKTGALGENINHGYMCQIIHVATETVVTKPDGSVVWNSVNEPIRAFPAMGIMDEVRSPVWVKATAGQPCNEKGHLLDENGERVQKVNTKGEPVWYTMSEQDCKRNLKNAGYEVKYVILNDKGEVVEK